MKPRRGWGKEQHSFDMGNQASSKEAVDANDAGNVEARGPAWTRGDMEPPAGERTWEGTSRPYTRRSSSLGVDERGQKVEESCGESQRSRVDPGGYGAPRGRGHGRPRRGGVHGGAAAAPGVDGAGRKWRKLR